MKRLLTAWCIGIAAVGITVPAALILPQPACADSWMPPETETILTPGGKCRLTVFPRDLSSQLDYFSDKVDGKEPAGQQPGGSDAAHALLERRGPDGRWHPIWRRELINDVAPVYSYVSASGRYVVTLDNWHSTGLGDRTIVIYDTHGGTPRRFELRTLMGDDYVATLPRSVSSMQWHGDARICREALIIPVTTPDGEHEVEIALDLSTGSITPVDDFEWRKARAAAGPALAVLRASLRARYEAQRSPIHAPRNADEFGWHHYLEEVWFRTAPDWREYYPTITVLRLPTAADYAPSLGWMHEAFADRFDNWPLMFGSADQANLANVLVVEARQLRPGALRGNRVYVAIDEALWPRIHAALAPSGATLIRLDPATPIPQRQERMPDPAMLLVQ
ncbi:hypothetical protein [Sphingomonas sp. OTU376]|uniref:hypothetical protein n=1 Tax=Sphingomonas sp. OTU376 TaxID=3043863 RepID=UPI00313E4592